METQKSAGLNWFWIGIVVILAIGTGIGVGVLNNSLTAGILVGIVAGAFATVAFLKVIIPEEMWECSRSSLQRGQMEAHNRDDGKHDSYYVLRMLSANGVKEITLQGLCHAADLLEIEYDPSRPRFSMRDADKILEYLLTQQ